MPPPLPPSAFLLPLHQLPDPLPIPPIERPFDVSIRPPGSKSITNRALLLAALADGISTLRGALVDADDAQVMIAALRRLGAAIEVDGDTVKVAGVAGRWKIAPGQTVHLDLHNAGTATRFLAAAAMLAPAGTSVVIDGDARMRERPIAELAEAVLAVGAKVEFLSRIGFAPLRVSPPTNMCNREVTFERAASSQFISAMLMVGCFLPLGLSVHLRGEVTSAWYISMTTHLAAKLGARIDRMPFVLGTNRHSRTVLRAAHRRLPAFSYNVEPDASSASYWLAAAALTPGSCVRLIDLLPPALAGDDSEPFSLQPDAAFTYVVERLGAQIVYNVDGLLCRGRGIGVIDQDFDIMPDTAMTAAVLACFADGTTTLRGLRTLRVKETDRLAALQTELSKLGAKVEIFQDGDDEGLRITAPAWMREDQGTSAGMPMPRVDFDTYNDHRMAMALALVGLRVPGIRIRNPACVAKTYPTFWRDFAKLYA